MRPARLLAATLLSGSAFLALALPATAAPLMGGSGLAQAVPANVVENVQYYYGGGPRYYRGGRYYGHHHYNDGAALGLGLAAGAIVGGAIAAGAAQANQNAAYCAQRYRSYDPRSGTYLSRDGNRYPCP
ncbi:MAG: BA14K family protein [Afipia sp.]|nr:BA14K family protein [Afipia sp.]